MKNSWRGFLAFVVFSLATAGFAQKIKVGYDKSADFSKYKTYTWAKPAMPITRPLLYQEVVGTIDDELKSKGLRRTDNNGDLTLIAAGGIGFGYNMPPAMEMNVAYWSGEEDPEILTAPMVAEGTLILEFVDRGQNKMVWRGTARENLDPEMAKSLPRIEKAIVKLLKVYPPKSSSK
jgi:Domain of unknown function (DUF4136)